MAWGFEDFGFSIFVLSFLSFSPFRVSGLIRSRLVEDSAPAVLFAFLLLFFCVFLLAFPLFRCVDDFVFWWQRHLHRHLHVVHISRLEIQHRLECALPCSESLLAFEIAVLYLGSVDV